MPTKATWQKLQVFKIQDGGRPPFWKLLNRHISVQNCPTTADIGPDYSHVTNEIFNIEDGDGLHVENRFLGRNSLNGRRISAKFCMRKQNGMSTKATWQKLQILKSKMADGCHFWIVKSPYLSEKSSDFVEIWCIIANFQPDYSHVTKNWNFKIQYCASRHLENRFLDHNSSTDCLISDKFCTKTQSGMPTKATWQKLQIFKIQDGGRTPFWKSLNHHISVKILSDFDKIWCTTADIEPDEILKSTITVS